MLRTQRRFGRMAMRSMNQVALSVLATLAATAIYSGLRHDPPPAIPVATAPPALTAGGKLAARIAGVARPETEASAPRLPLLSTLSWGAPPALLARFDDPAWTDPTPAGSAAHARFIPVSRRPETVAAAASPHPGAAPPAVSATPVVLAAADNPLWTGARTAVGTATSAISNAGAMVGSATSTATSAVRGVVALGGTLVARVMP